MVEEASLEFRLIKIDETRNYSYKKNKKTCKYLNYLEQLLILVSIVLHLLH